MSEDADRPSDAPAHRPLHPRRALVSVSDKTGLPALAEGLAALGIEIVSTGGTASALRDLGLTPQDVSELTGFPEMLDGRVKTLHPAVHGPILARRDRESHMAALAEHGLSPIDLIIVNLYPFEATVARGADFETCVEQIDIGGPAMIRAAAKNWAHVAVVTDPSDYSAVLAALSAGDGIGAPLRRDLAGRAFARVAAYDAAIAARFVEERDGPAAGPPAELRVSAPRTLTLRYGENPHQSAAFYATDARRIGVATAELRQGKALSYNNLNDINAAFELVSDLDRFGRSACAIIKHANPCGAALGDDLEAAYRAAKRCDPTSAFGGVIAVNQRLDAQAAAAILEIFTEAVIAPEISPEAAELFAAKPDIRVLAAGGLPDPTDRSLEWRSIAGGVLAQERDAGVVAAKDLKAVTRRAPTPREIDDLLFAWTVAKHVKSNAIVYAADGATIGVGAGQMSRLDSSRIAAQKAADIQAAEGLSQSPAVGAVVASDAFFPFPDGLLAAAAAGVTAAIQPGGSKRDQDVIKAADSAGISMVFTGMRHFRH